MTPSPDPEILARLKEIESRISTSTYLTFSYVQAILALLSEKGITNNEEFQEYLQKARQELAGMIKDAEFFRMMGGVNPPEPPQNPPPFQDKLPEAEK